MLLALLGMEQLRGGNLMIRFWTTHGGAAFLALLLALVLAIAGCAEKPTPDQMLASAKQEREKGNYTTAVIHLKNALQQVPEHAEARYLLGVTYNDMGEYKAAEIELRRAMDLRYDLAKVKIGRSLLMLREYKKI